MPGGKLLLPESERLAFRAWGERDWPFFAAMNANPRVMRFFPAVMTEEESRAMWNRLRAELDEKGYGVYAVELKSSGSLIGLLGFHWADFKADFTPCVEILEAWNPVPSMRFPPLPPVQRSLHPMACMPGASVIGERGPAFHTLSF